MNKLTWITNILACLMIVLAALGSLCGALTQMAFDPQFYDGMSRQAVAQTLGAEDAEAQVTAYIGLTDEEQGAFAQEMVSFLKGETPLQPDVLNEKEQQHMLDVRALVLLAQRASQMFMTLAAGLAVVIAWTGAQNKRKGMPLGMLIGLGVIALGVFGAYALLNTQGFEALFIRFHEIFFTNDLWLMNPETDILIRMMPQRLFERAGMELVRLALMSFAVTNILLILVYTLVGGMIRRQMTQKNG